MNKINHNAVRGMTLMILFSLLDSTAGLFIKLLPWNPLVIAGIRGLLAFVLLFIFYRIRKNRIVFSINSVLGGAVISVMFITFVTATRFTTAANAALLQYSNPVFIMLFGYLLFRQKPKAGDIGVVAAIMTGIILLFWGNYSPGQHMGNTLALISGAAFAAMFSFNNHVKSETDHISAIILGHFFTFLVCLPFLFITPPVIKADTILPILGLSILQQAIPFIIYAKAIRICSPLPLSLITMIGPMLNPLLVRIFLGESPSSSAIIGGTLILLSIAVWSTIRIRSGTIE
jgi:drug/metabolite transporter (DMT)-like permease